jgi:hypothetical protein
MGTHMKTTIEISTPLLRRAKRLASREGITLRSLVEEGLQKTLKIREHATPAVLPPLLVVGGRGMNPEFAQGGWDKIRDAIYEGRGA